MSSEIRIDKDKSVKEIYQQLLPQLNSLLVEEEPLISGLANFTAVLKQSFSKISWIGFYFAKDKKLFLGPFQGKSACTVIEIGKGVCGTSALKKETIIVENVDEFPGHIACDSGSKSEIVIPIIKDKTLVGVLDLDSYYYSSFNEIDKEYLEKLVELLLEKFDFQNHSLTE